MTIDHRRLVRLSALAVSVIGLAIATGEAIRFSGHELVFNDSPSVPRGLYWIRVGVRPAHRGEYVVFAPPADAAALIVTRGWLPVGMPVLKPVAGMAGDTYCVHGDRFSVNGADVGPVFERDAQGLPMPHITGCHRVGSGQFLPASAHLARSFDGRYMGAVPLVNVFGTGRPLVTF